VRGRRSAHPATVCRCSTRCGRSSARGSTNLFHGAGHRRRPIATEQRACASCAGHKRRHTSRSRRCRAVGSSVPEQRDANSRATSHAPRGWRSFARALADLGHADRGPSLRSRSLRSDVAATYPYVDKGPRLPRGDDREIDLQPECNRLARPPVRGYLQPRNAPLVRVFPSVRRQKRSSRSSVNAGAVCFCRGPLGTSERYGSPAGPRKPAMDTMATTERL